MPKLKYDERMQRCEFEEHDEYKRQKYYIVRSYANELEQHFCYGCLCIMQRSGHVKYDGMEGFVPVSASVESLLNIYGIKDYYELKITKQKELLTRLLDNMDVPEARLDFTLPNLDWINRNLGVRNQDKPLFHGAIAVTRKLIKELA